MKKFFAFAIAAAFAITASATYANNVGCGFGTEVMKGKKGKVFEVLAVTTNGTSGSSTFAITSGTSGYKEGVVIGMNEEVKNFVAKNMEGLASDIARGNGEYLAALSGIMQVEDRAAFGSKLKSNFDSIYTSETVTSEEVSENIIKVFQS